MRSRSRRAGHRDVRVLVVAPGHMVGGQARAARDIADGFAGGAHVRAGFQAIDPRLPGRLAPLTRWKGIRSMVRPALYVKQLLRAVPQHDVLHVFCAAHSAFFFGAIPALVVGRLFRKPVLLNYHDGRAESHFRWWGPVLRWAIRAADALVFPSPYLQTVFQARGFTGEVVPNVVDTSAYAFRLPDPPPARMVSARMLESLYDVGNTIRAFALVRERVPDMTCHIYGSGSKLAELQRLADDLCPGGVIFHGEVRHHDMPAVFAEGGILVNSSRVDNMPHVIIEAFAAGLPVVSTAAGGIPHMVRDGDNALLVPIGDPRVLADAVVRVMTVPGLARRLAEKGREECTQYTWERAARGWTAIYRRLQRNSIHERSNGRGKHGRASLPGGQQ